MKGDASPLSSLVQGLHPQWHRLDSAEKSIICEMYHDRGSDIMTGVTCEETHDSRYSKNETTHNNGITKCNCYIRTMTWQREVIQMTWREWHEKCHKMWREKWRRTSSLCQSFERPCWWSVSSAFKNAINPYKAVAGWTSSNIRT